MSAYRVCYLRGNTRHRDHAHWIIDAATPIVEVSPVFDLTAMQVLIWRIKTFHITSPVSSSGTWTAPVIGSTPEPWSLSHALDYLQPRVYQPNATSFSVADCVDERDLLGGRYTHLPHLQLLHDKGFDYPSPGITIESSFVNWSAIDERLWLPPNFGAGFNDQVPYNFSFSLTGHFPSAFYAPGFDVTMHVSFDQSQYPHLSPGNLTFAINGYTWSKPLGSDYTATSNFGFTVNAQSAAVSVLASEYFPFKDSHGNPVYDSVSGAQLNDPFG
jgi:hypothetical protein